MKLLPKVLVLVSIFALASPLAIAASPASRTGVSSTHSRATPLLGSWSLDTSRMPLPPDQRPKSVRLTFGDAGGGKWTVHVDVVYAPGNEVHSVSTSTLDGTPAAVENSPEADRVALKHPSPNVLVMALLKKGVLVSTRIYSAMPGGHDLVETAVYPGRDGTPVMKTNYFTHVR
jgi:hypothetical protein